jgi:two-component system LytT family response regulator
MSKKLNAYIVEDDVENIELLKLLVKKCCPTIEFIGEATNTEELIDLLLLNKADIIFLDIDLQEERNSLDVLHNFGHLKTEIIITSSSEEYAIKALNEYNISSYILKPINILSLQKAMDKLEETIKQKELISGPFVVQNLAENVIAISDVEKIEILDIENIMYLEADGKYTIFHLANGSSKMVSRNIGSYIDILPKNKFFRIHHKYIINIGKTESIYKTDGHYCLLKDSKTLPIAKRRLEEFRKFLYLK